MRTKCSSLSLRFVLAAILGLLSSQFAECADPDAIQPFQQDPRYWQYKGQPVMLLGGSVTDHLFLIDRLKEHLDEIHSVGGNYIRNTMSQREQRELKPHLLLPSGKFDLDQWNPDYWKRFENMLRWTAEREIIVQIEVWDRFDFSREHWGISPWNPENNVNYDGKQSGLANAYPQHPSRDLQPFFHSIQGMPRYNPKLDRVRKYQEAFVTKMLSYSLQNNNVLYCMDNETSTPAEWGKYWIEFIHQKAADQGQTVCTTDMFDDAFRGDEAKHTPLIFSDPTHYTFADISQVNSRNFNEAHWERLQWLLERVNSHPRPSNHTKIYGSGYKSFGTGGPEDGVERFWRDILGGSAAARFHREDSGNGLNDHAKASLRAARLLETQIKFWQIEPHMELLSDRESNEAYLAAAPGKAYALYFTNGGSVKLDLTDAPGEFNVTWISVSMGITTDTTSEPGKSKATSVLTGGKAVSLTAPYKGGWVAAITREGDRSTNSQQSNRDYDRFSGLVEFNSVKSPPEGQTIVLNHVTLIDGTGRPPVEDAVIIVRGNRILNAGKIAPSEFPMGAAIVDGTGFSVLPGLVDTHFHIGSSSKMYEIPPLFLTRGVTTARDPGRPIDIYVPIRGEENRVPRLFVTGPHFDQSPPAHPHNAVIIDSPQAAEKAVLKYLSEGASAIKIYFRLPVDCIRQACETAHQQGIPVTAHLELMDADQCIAAGLDGVEHVTSFGTVLADEKTAAAFRRSVNGNNSARLEGRYSLWSTLSFKDNPLAAAQIDQIVREGVYLSPTLATFEMQAGPDTTETQVAGFKKMQQFVGLCHQSGVLITTGSHTFSKYVDLGWAYQREMELLVESGLSPMEVITASTLNGAQFLGCADRLGTLQAEKLADLILVEGRPDQSIRNMYNVKHVMLNGVWIGESP